MSSYYSTFKERKENFSVTKLNNFIDQMCVMLKNLNVKL